MDEVPMAWDIVSQRHWTDPETANRECIKRLCEDVTPAHLEFLLVSHVMIADDGDASPGILLDVLGMIAMDM
jgi:hypothetical protein